MAIVPDIKSWTWVLDRACPDCGFDASSVDMSRMGDLIRANAAEWPALLADEHVRLRPTGDQWSALEYGCHVRDVFRIYDERLQLMLTTDDPHFTNWDQDASAIDERYDLQDPELVAQQLVAAAEGVAATWDSVRPDQWGRLGYRSDGVEFSVESIGRYFLHDPVHHVDDVRRGNVIITDSSLD